MKHLISIILSSFLLSTSFGQLTTAGGAPTSLVQNVLLGPGVTVSNINYSGSPTAIGSFTANNTNLGISSGIIMTTGTIFNNGDGPHGPNNSPSSGVDNNFGGFPLLTSIVGNATYNASVLEFDFVPYSDTVRFRYVFGSEEYFEYVGTQFNDVFGFFISGPGISGNQNIAKIPGTNTPVAINNVNNGNPSSNPPVGASNPAYYVSNNGGSTIQYDGFTKPLEAVAKVQCGQTYHLTIALADVGDGIYDSGIFLEANSLQSKTPVEIDYDLSYHAYADQDVMAEGCVTTTFTLSRTNNLNLPLTVPINVAGTATEGVDYSSIPSSVTFAAGQSQIQFSFDAFADGITEGLETILLEFLMTDPCGNITPYLVDLGIEDVQPLNVEVNNDTLVCAGDEALLTGVVTGGVGPFDYEWNTSETTESITVNPQSTTTYSLTVTDQCTNDQFTGNGIVTVPVYAPITLISSPNITEICPYLPTDLSVQASGGTGIYSYQWSDNFGTQYGQSNNQTVIPSQTTTYTVTVTDQCGANANASIIYTITSPPLVVDISPVQNICPFDSALISASATGGYGQYFFYWPQTGETTSDIWVTPSITTNYQVVVSDECQTFSVPAITQVIVQKPTANFNPSSHTLFDDLPITFQNLTANGETYEWDFGDGNNSELVHPNNTYDIPGDYIVTLIATDDLGCKDTIQKPLTIIPAHYIYVPNTFTPDGNMVNNSFSASTFGIEWIEVRIFNRWGEMVFTSNEIRFEWDGTYKGNLVQDGTYTYQISYRAISGVEDKLIGHVNVLK